MNRFFYLFLVLGIFSLFLFRNTPLLAGGYSFPPYTVTNIIVVPADIEMDPEYPKLVSEAVRKVQTRYSEILGGPTFSINDANGTEVIVFKSERKLKEFCNPTCRPLSSLELKYFGSFPVNQRGVILNTFTVGVSFGASAGPPADILPNPWESEDWEGVAFNGNSVLLSLKESTDRRSELLCQTYLGRSCRSESGLYVIAHELGHTFGLSDVSRWAVPHSCSTANPEFCRSGLDRKFYPGPEESNNSIMGYGINAFRTNITFNDSCVNPEKTILKNSKFFGGNGFKGLNFENCLKLPTAELKIASLDRDFASPGDELTIHIEGLLPSDSEIQVIFPPDNPARSLERVDNNTLKVIVPDNAVSGEIIVSVLRDRQQIRSNPTGLRIISTSPIISKIEPLLVKPGDIITLTGENLIPQGQGSLSAPIVRFGEISQEEIIESSPKQIKLRVPGNASLGKMFVYITIRVLNPESKEFVTSHSNSVALTILPAGSLTAVLEGPLEIKVGESADFKTYVTEENAIPRAAEILVRSFDLNTPCNGELLQDQWCKISKDNFLQSEVSGRARTLTGQYIPTKKGTYAVVINAYGANETKCSGYSGRPSDWIDCGERSSLAFRVIDKEQPPATPGPIPEEQGSINAVYYIENKSDKLLKVKPKICKKIKGILDCIGEGGKSILPGDTLSNQYSLTNGPDGPIKQGEEYTVGCWIDEVDANRNYIKKIGECPIKTAFVGDNTILNFNIQVTDKGVESTIAPTPSASTAPICSLTASANNVKVGEYIKWGIENSPPGVTAYWRGSNNGISIIPTDVEGYSNTTSWSQEYKYTVPGYYERFVGIQDKEGKTVCTTDKVLISVGAEQILVPIVQRSEPVNTTLPIEGRQSAPNQTAQNLQKSAIGIFGILVNGQRVGFGGTSVSIRLPDIVAKGATQAIPVTVSYLNGTSFSKNIVFRYKLAGTQASGEKALPGEECDPQKFSCFATAERSDNNPEFLFCRNIGESTNKRYEWVTQKFTTDICQGKEGITSTCGNGQGQETKYWCTGENWVDEAGWKEYQRKLAAVHSVLPQRQIAEGQKKLEEESKSLSCSLEAYPQRIKVGQEITWIIKTHNFTGTFAEWRGTDNGQELVIPVPVHEFPKPNSPNLWMENYPYNRGGTYTRYAVIKDAEGRACQTNTLEAVIEDSNIAQGLPGGEALISITRYVNQQPKTVSKIILLLPPYGQQREVQPGERTQFSLPDTGGVPQTVQLPITIIYSDGSTGNKTISFAYKGNMCSLSNGKCATDGGNTADGYTCTTYRPDLTGCPRDDRYAYCFTSCTKQPSTTTQTTPSVPTTAQPKTCQDLGGECIYANYTGTAPGGRTCKTYLGDEVSRSSCQQYYYCWKDCTSSPQQTTPSIPQTEPTSTCNGTGEYCAGSDGNPKDPGFQCNATKAYRNNSAKDQWCQGGEPGWYCWLCQQ